MARNTAGRSPGGTRRQQRRGDDQAYAPLAPGALVNRQAAVRTPGDTDHGANGQANRANGQQRFRLEHAPRTMCEWDNGSRAASIPGFSCRC